MDRFKKNKSLSFSLLTGFLALMFVTCSKTSDVEVKNVTLNQPTLTITVDAGFQLVTTITPSDASNKNVTWKSDNPAVATVSSGGYVEGVSVGGCIVTVTTDNGKTANCIVTVLPAVGKTRAQVRAAFEAQGYTTEVSQDIASMGMPAFTFEKGDGATKEQMVAIFFTSEEVAAVAKPQYDEIAMGFGYVCKQDGRILYYGTAAAMQLFEEI